MGGASAQEAMLNFFTFFRNHLIKGDKIKKLATELD